MQDVQSNGQASVMMLEHRRPTLELLLIEGDPRVSLLLRELLAVSEAQTEVGVASDGEKALDVLRKIGKFAPALRPDVIILDLDLPTMSGLELLTTIKNDDALRPIPVIMFSSSPWAIEAAQAHDHPACCYIAKPTTPERLQETIKHIEDLWSGEVPPRPA